MTNPDGSPMGAGVEGNVGASVIPFVGGMFDSWMASRTAKKNTEMTIQAQKEQAELAYQRQVEFWHMQNAYNSPEAQMRRFGAAGLNPHLIYGQGNAGNASSTPQYQSPNLQYRYAAPAYGAAVSSILPTLMAVGTWMQNMRMTEVDIQAKRTNMEKASQAIGFLEQMNPRRVQELENKLSLYPYQESMQRSLSDRAQVQASDLLEEFRYKWGVPLETELNQYTYSPRGGGAKGVEFLRKLAEQRLKSAQASWTDFNITNPQALIQMVLGGVMGMAGQTMRINQKARTGFTPRKITTRFNSQGRRVYQRAE